MDEYKKTEVTVKFYLPDNQDDFWFAMNGRTMWLLLMEIDNECRKTSKFSDCEKSAEFAESIIQMIRENINLNEVS